MEIKEHYFEVRKILVEKISVIYSWKLWWPRTYFCTQVCDIIDGLFVAIFKHLNENCKRELETINRQYPFEPLKVKPYFILFYVVICMLFRSNCFSFC
jgi:hypothetical protein